VVVESEKKGGVGVGAVGAWGLVCVGEGDCDSVFKGITFGNGEEGDFGLGSRKVVDDVLGFL